MTDGTPDLASAARKLLTCCRQCRDEAPPFSTDIPPAEFILWGKLFPPEALGPRCWDHAHAWLGASISRVEGVAVVDLRPIRAALAHDQQDEPTAAIPLPGEGWYSVTVEHLVDKFEKQHPTQTWEVVSRGDGGGFSVEPMTYPEPGVSDTPEPDIPREPNGRPVVTFDAEGPWPEPQVSMIVDPVTGRDERAPATPEGGESGPESEKPSPGTVSQTELDDRAEFGVTQAELNVINDEVQAEAERAQPTDDELLARAEWDIKVLRAGDGTADIGDDMAELAAALRDARRKSSVEIRHLIDKCDRLERELAEARPHGEVLADATVARLDAGTDGDDARIVLYATVTGPLPKHGDEVQVVVRPVEDQEETDG